MSFVAWIIYMYSKIPITRSSTFAILFTTCNHPFIFILENQIGRNSGDKQNLKPRYIYIHVYMCIYVYMYTQISFRKLTN